MIENSFKIGTEVLWPPLITMDFVKEEPVKPFKGQQAYKESLSITYVQTLCNKWCQSSIKTYTTHRLLNFFKLDPFGSGCLQCCLKEFNFCCLLSASKPFADCTNFPTKQKSGRESWGQLCKFGFPNNLITIIV